MERGEAIYKEVCFACHGDDGRGTRAAGGPRRERRWRRRSRNSSRVQGHRDYVIKTLLHGMDGPIEGRTYAARRHGADGHEPRRVDRGDRVLHAQLVRQRRLVRLAGRRRAGARRRPPTASRSGKSTSSWRRCRSPLEVLPTWKASASHNPATALGALNFASWTSGAPQQPGMWFQIELPEAATVTELQFNSAGRRIRRWRRADAAAVPAWRPARGAARSGGAAGPYPRQYQSRSLDGRHELDRRSPKDDGTPGSTTITFAPVTAKYVRITQTATVEDAPVWSMQRLRLYRPGVGGGRAKMRSFR